MKWNHWDSFSPTGKPFPPELIKDPCISFHFHGSLFTTWSGWEPRGQNGIRVETVGLEFLQTPPGKEVPWISEESLFAWGFLPSLYSTCPNISDNLQLNSRLLHIDWNQAVSEAYSVSNTYNLRKYNNKADRGHPKAGPTSLWTEASLFARPSVPGPEPRPSFQASPSVCPAFL